MYGINALLQCTASMYCSFELHESTGLQVNCVCDCGEILLCGQSKALVSEVDKMKWEVGNVNWVRYFWVLTLEYL